MRRGLRVAAGEDVQTVAPSLNVVKHVCVATVDSCQKRLVARAGKAVSRAQRGRSGIEDTRSALSARVASRIITARRPKIATWIYTHSPPPRCMNPTTTSPTETPTAWRERPPRWPRAWRARRSQMVVAHATVLRLATSPTSSSLAGGTERRPSHTSSNSQRWLKLAEAVARLSAVVLIAIRPKSE
jgi:hypothetical protein